MFQRAGILAVASFAFVAMACASEAEVDEGELDSEVTQCRLPKRERKVDVTKRADLLANIKRVAVDENVPNAALLIAGIGAHETGLTQCWKDAKQFCQGPWSSTCNGPVLAGGADGPCSQTQGGLGIFQFDSGTHAATVRAYGDGILSESGNVRAATRLVLQKLQICPNGPPLARRSTPEAAAQWLDDVRIGTESYEQFLDAMARCYNGADSRTCRFKQVRASYDMAIRFLLEDAGERYWYSSR